MSRFTEEELKELETIFGLKRVEEILPVRDGVVTKSTKVWWRCTSGPQHVIAKEHWVNIAGYPDAYSLGEPSSTVTYLD